MARVADGWLGGGGADGWLATTRTALTSLLVPNETLLDDAAVLNGFEIAGDNSPLSCVRARLQSGRPLAIGVLGGSVSAGSSISINRASSWLFHAKLMRALNKAFAPMQGGRHVRLSAAMPATGPAWVEHCLDDLLGSEMPLDLVLVEFAVNLDAQPAAFERMLRKLLRRQQPRSPPAVLIVSTHEWPLFKADGKAKPGCWPQSEVTVDGPTQRRQQRWHDDANRGDEDAIANISSHYGVPLVSMRGALLDSVRSGAMPLRSFMMDCRHPSGQGHTFLAQLVLARLLASSQQTRAPPAAADATCHRPPSHLPLPLPRPLHAAGMPMPDSQCAHGLRLNGLATHRRGFVFTDEGRRKPGLVANRPSSAVEFCLMRRSPTTQTQLPLPQPQQERVQQSSPPQQQPACLDQGRPPGLHRGAMALARARAARLTNNVSAVDAASPAVKEKRRPPRGGCPACGSLPKCGGKWYEAPPPSQLLATPRCVTSAGDVRDFDTPSRYCRDNVDLCAAVPHVRKACSATCGTCAAAATTTGSSSNATLGLWLAYLSSYAGMGRASVTCSGACACEAILDAHRPDSHASVTAVQRLTVTRRLPPSPSSSSSSDAAGAAAAACDCAVHVRVLPETSSGGHKFKVLSLLLAQRGQRDEWNPPGVGRKISLAFDRVMEELNQVERLERRPGATWGL